MTFYKIPGQQREKLVKVLHDLASKDPEQARAAVARLGEPEHRKVLVECIRMRLHDEGDDRAADIVDSTLASLLKNNPVDESDPEGPKRLDTFDSNDPLAGLVRVMDKRVKRDIRRRKPVQGSVVERGLSGSLDGTTELTKLLSTGEYADSDEDLPQVILTKAEEILGVAEAFKSLPSDLRDLATKRWLTIPPVPWKDIEVAERRGQRMLIRAKELLVNKLREMDLLDQDEADRLLSAKDGDR